MIYLTTVSFLFVILSYSNFLTIKLNIKASQSFLLSCCIIILIGCFFLIIQEKYHTQLMNEFIILIIILSFFTIPFIKKNYYKINKTINIEFFIIFIIFFLLCKDRYYLDQDEITYWGRTFKKMVLQIPLSTDTHHPQGLLIFSYPINFFKLNEGMTIFSNNIILISGYFFLFYEKRFILFEKIIIFLIYFLLLNNLSFGFVSFYSDPVLAMFFACLLKIIYFYFYLDKKTNLINFLMCFLLIALALLQINRASPIYFSCGILFLFSLVIIEYFDKRNFNHYLLIFFSITTLIYFFYSHFLTDYLHGHYLKETIIKNIIKFFQSSFLQENYIDLLLSPIYFSEFGVLFNAINEYYSFINYKLPEFQILLVVYILLFFLFLSFKFPNKLYLISFSICVILSYSWVVFILKFQIENLNILALPRYIGIIILALFFFLFSIVLKYCKHLYYNLTILLFLALFISVAPKKTLGLFVSDKIYYSDPSNHKYKINRQKIKALTEKVKDYDEVIVIHQFGMSDYTDNLISGEHTFYHDIITYELYPLSRISFYELKKFKNNLENFSKIKTIKFIFIYFDLSANEIKMLSSLEDSLIINTY